MTLSALLQGEPGDEVHVLPGDPEPSEAGAPSVRWGGEEGGGIIEVRLAAHDPVGAGAFEAGVGVVHVADACWVEKGRAGGQDGRDASVFGWIVPASKRMSSSQQANKSYSSFRSATTKRCCRASARLMHDTSSFFLPSYPGALPNCLALNPLGGRLLAPSSFPTIKTTSISKPDKKLTLQWLAAVPRCRMS